MTGTTASISVSAKLPGPVAVPSPLTIGMSLVTPDGAPGATPTLAAFVDLMLGNAVAPKDEQPAEDRQDDAATGKSLPEKDEAKADPALAWLFSVAPITLPVPQPALAAAPPAGSPAAVPAASLPAIITTPQISSTPGNPGTPAATSAHAANPFAQPGIEIALPQAAARPVLPEGVEITLPKAPAAAVPAADAAPAAPTVPPIRAAVPLAQAAIAASIAPTLIASAPMPALFALAGVRERDRTDDSDSATLTAATGAVLLQPADAAQLIAKPGGAQGQALDMGRQDWPQKMIDRIETLRDSANANDTSIRLKPEALGRVDISLRTHADGAVSVRFSAEQPATRTLIADAQPQLQAAAEARGIRLSGASVDLSGSGAGASQQQQPRFELQQNITNHLAASGEDIEAVEGGRIA